LQIRGLNLSEVVLRGVRAVVALDFGKAILHDTGVLCTTYVIVAAPPSIARFR
jgi:hypothetical protein